MASLGDLSKRMKDLSSSLSNKERATAAPRDKSGRFLVQEKSILANTALIMLETVIELTPVDTGRAVSNWQIESESLRQSVEIEPYFEGIKGSTAAQCISAARNNAKRDIKAWNGSDDLHVVNPVRYVIYLNDGTATRPGLFMIERAVAAGQAYVRSIKRG